MTVRIQTRRSTTSGAVPSTLELGELALNIEDRKLFVGGSSGVIETQMNPFVLFFAPITTNMQTRIFGDICGTALTTLALTASRVYFIPFMVPQRTVITGLRLSVTTASAGTASAGIYSNALSTGTSAGNAVPADLLASVSGLDMGSTGDKSANFASPLTVYPGVIYWAAMISSSAATLRAVPVASGAACILGRVPASNSACFGLYVAGSGSTLPNPAPNTIGSYTRITSNFPAIYLI